MWRCDCQWVEQCASGAAGSSQLLNARLPGDEKIFFFSGSELKLGGAVHDSAFGFLVLLIRISRPVNALVHASAGRVVYAVASGLSSNRPRAPSVSSQVTEFQRKHYCTHICDDH